MESGTIRKRKVKTGTVIEIWVACQDCGKERWTRCIRGKMVFPRCQSCAQKEKGKRFMREDNPCWKGGRVVAGDGYVLINLPKNNPYALMKTIGGRYVAEHRLVMAQYLGRCLESWEVVHHKNGIKDDNRIENLELFPQQYSHYSITILERKVKCLEEEIIKLKTKLGE